eukprot:COSAG04_NODE_3271_length_2989_cov_2.298513_5_plen_109_part_01
MEHQEPGASAYAAAEASDLDFALPSWGDEPEPEPEPRIGGGAPLQLAPATSREETVSDMRARLQRMEARARQRTASSATPARGLDESRLSAPPGSPLHSLQRRAEMGSF